MNTLETGEALADAVQKTPHRVTLDSLKAKITAEEYFHPTFAPHLTVCVLLTENGFTLVGKSAPADPANFDAEAGRRFAYDDALLQLWTLEGYLLREKMFMAEPVQGPAHDRVFNATAGRPGYLIAEVPEDLFRELLAECPPSKRWHDRGLTAKGIDNIRVFGRYVVVRIDPKARGIILSDQPDVVGARARNRKGG